MNFIKLKKILEIYKELKTISKQKGTGDASFGNFKILKFITHTQKPERTKLDPKYRKCVKFCFILCFNKNRCKQFNFYLILRT